MSPAGPPKDALAGHSVVARADALMQRRRAQNGELDDLPVLTEAVPTLDEDDFPVLTAIEPEPEVNPEPAQPAVPKPAPPAAAMDPQAFEKLAQELTKTITARLNAEIPHLVHIALQETLVSIEKELRTGISEATETALRDFLKAQAHRG